MKQEIGHIRNERIIRWRNGKQEKYYTLQPLRLGLRDPNEGEECEKSFCSCDSVAFLVHLVRLREAVKKLFFWNNF